MQYAAPRAREKREAENRLQPYGWCAGQGIDLQRPHRGAIYESSLADDLGRKRLGDGPKSQWCSRPNGAGPMVHLQQSSVRNRLLRALSPDDFALVQDQLETVSLNLRDVLIAPNEKIEHVFFMESGFSSTVARVGDEGVEVGITGREGFVGLPVVLGSEESPHQSFIQGAGSALRIRADHLRQATYTSRSLQELLLGFVHVAMVQTAQTAFTNATYTMEARLARWLLMSQDRVGGDELLLTHEFIALMLGARRPGVTGTVHALEGSGLIKARRGRITILDRERLEELADGIYGVPEAVYERFLSRRS